MNVMEYFNSDLTIQEELLSNCINNTELRETKYLFQSIKAIRNPRNDEYTPAALKNINSLKDCMVSLLYASGIFPLSSSVFSLNTAQSAKDRHYLPATDITWRAGAGGVSADPFPPASVRVSPADGISALSKIHPASAAEDGSSRMARNTDKPESLYLPSVETANENFKNYLAQRDAPQRIYSLDSHGLINAAVDIIQQHRHGLRRVVGQLLKSSGLYGADRKDKLSEATKMKTLQSWMAQLLFKGSAETFVAGAFLKLYQNHTAAVTVSSSSFHRYLNLEKHFNENGDGGQTSTLTDTALQYIHDNIILPIVPTFHLDTLPGMPLPGSLEWGCIHTGLSFAISAGLDWRALSLEGFSAVGMLLESMLREGLLDLSQTKPLLLPAMFHYIKSQSEQGRTLQIEDIIVSGIVKEPVLAFYLDASERLSAKKNTETYYYELMEHYQSRGKLAQEILKTTCLMETAPEKNQINEYKYFHDSLICSDINNMNGKTDATLPDLNATFKRQNNEIADAFAAFDKQNIMAVLGSLAPAEYDFLYSATIKRVRASFRNQIETRTVWGYTAIKQYNDLYIADTNDLFLAQTDSGEKTYALIYRNDAYELKRMDDNASSYFELMKNYRPDLENDPNIRVSLIQEERRYLKRADQRLEELAINLSRTHRHKLFGQLHSYGYDATTAETARELTYSLIPLYDCVNAIRENEEEAAVLACSADAVMMLPLAKIALGLGSRIAIKSAFGTRAALTSFISTLIMRRSLRAGLKSGLSRMVHYAVMPVSRELNRKFLAHVGIEILRLFDPGFELMKNLSHMTLSQVSKAMRIASKESPALQHILPMLEEQLAGQTLQAPTTVHMARHPMLGKEVPVVKLAGETFEGRDVYLRVNPETHDPFGLKYTLTQDNRLARVPATFAERLNNLHTQGLSGRGAKARGSSWPAETGAGEIHESLLDITLRQPDGRRPPARYSDGLNEPLASADKAWRQNYDFVKSKPFQFAVATRGDPDSEKILFPERGILLQQRVIDATEYERAFARLSQHEKDAVRTWTLIDGDHKNYSDGTPNLTRQFKEPINVEINGKLRDGIPLSREEHRVYEGVMAFLQKDIPRQPGSYLRVAEYRDNFHIPWNNDINVGDIVTNYPQLMSVSADSQFARLFVEQAAEDGPLVESGMNAIVVYRIDNAKTCTPLLPMAASTVTHEVEYLYPPKSFFRVKGISVATGMSEFFHPEKRIGVILEEIDVIPQSAKNLFSGRELSGRSGIGNVPGSGKNT